MSLPEESVAANTLPEVTTIPTGKKLIFTDPDTNEGGIITLENLSKQILQNLTSQTFALDQGNLTLLQALNQLNSNASLGTITGTNSLEEYSVSSGKKPGVYKLAGVVIPGISNENWYGALVLLQTYEVQIVIVGAGKVFVRDKTGQPAIWQPWWKYNQTIIQQ